jgi:Secretion system C-terminal sorting domain
MIEKIATGLLCLWVQVSFAQITVTNATFPSVGDTLRYQLDVDPAGLNLGTAGVGNQTWDFTSLDGGPVQTTIWLAPDTGNGAANFPNAHLRTANQDGSTFYRKTSTRLDHLGTSGVDLLNLGINTAVRYQPALPVRRAPQQFFDIYTVESDLIWAVATGDLADSLLGQLGAFVDSFRFRIHTTRLDVVDAWGTCLIPNGSFPVLREKRTETTETSIDVHSFLGWTDLSALLGGGGSNLLGNIGKDTTTTFHFFSATEKAEIALVTLDNAGNAAQSVRFKYIPATVSIDDLRKEQPAIVVAPNPAGDQVNIAFQGFLPDTYWLQIHDTQGKLVSNQSVRIDGSAFPIPLSTYPSGLLLVQILNLKGQVVATQKVLRLQ